MLRLAMVTISRSWQIVRLLITLTIFGAGAAHADLPSDIGLGPQEALLGAPSSHWVWVNDMVFPHMADGTAMLVDGDTGRYLGTLSTGFNFFHVLLPHDNTRIYSPETYFSRGNRGERTDVVTVYDAKTLRPVKEILIPPKRSANLPMIANSALTDDDRFLLIYNFTPAQSVTIVDMRAEKFVQEVETPGCALVYPTGPRSFFSVCGDGSLALAQIAESGSVSLTRSERIFSPEKDPATEKAVRVGGTWYFCTYDGYVYPVTLSSGKVVKGEIWSLTNKSERLEGWRPGGQQSLAADSASQLYALVHQGGLFTHKDPGKDVWVFDLGSHKRTRQIKLRELASAIQVSRDGSPLLFTVFADKPELAIYDARSGEFQRSVDQIGTTPMLLVTP